MDNRRMDDGSWIVVYCYVRRLYHGLLHNNSACPVSKIMTMDDKPSPIYMLRLLRLVGRISVLMQSSVPTSRARPLIATRIRQLIGASEKSEKRPSSCAGDDGERNAHHDLQQS